MEPEEVTSDHHQDAYEGTLISSTALTTPELNVTEDYTRPKLKRIKLSEKIRLLELERTRALIEESERNSQGQVVPGSPHKVQPGSKVEAIAEASAKEAGGNFSCDNRKRSH